MRTWAKAVPEFSQGRRIVFKGVKNKQTNNKTTQPIAKLTWCYPVGQCRCGDLSSRSLECTSYASSKWHPCYIVDEMNYNLATAAYWKPQQLPRTNHGWERRPPLSLYLLFQFTPHLDLRARPSLQAGGNLDTQLWKFREPNLTGAGPVSQQIHRLESLVTKVTQI